MMFIAKENEKIGDSIKLLNNVQEELIQEIKNKNRFYLANVDGNYIGKLIEDFSITIRIVTYKSKWPWSKVLGYVTPNEPYLIYLNSRKLDRSLASIAGSIMHEAIHVIDNYDEKSFGHGNNNPSDKQNTAPYWIGKKAKELCACKKI